MPAKLFSDSFPSAPYKILPIISSSSTPTEAFWPSLPAKSISSSAYKTKRSRKEARVQQAQQRKKQTQCKNSNGSVSLNEIDLMSYLF